jgi:hypothetical protein
MIKDIKVAIVEDQRQTREGLATLIDGTPGYRTVGVWNSMEDALAKIEREPPDVRDRRRASAQSAVPGAPDSDADDLRG